jgi:hypothetical protein
MWEADNILALVPSIFFCACVNVSVCFFKCVCEFQLYVQLVVSVSLLLVTIICSECFVMCIMINSY